MDEGIGTVANTVKAFDSGTSSVATMRGVGDTGGMLGEMLGKMLGAYNPIDTAHGCQPCPSLCLLSGVLMRNT